jgi:hypothetical protein
MDQVIIQTPTPSLEESIRFYESLDFHNIPDIEGNLYTDGKVLVDINEDRFGRLGFKFYKKNWIAELDKLKQCTTVIEISQGYLTTDPNGIWVYLISQERTTFALGEKSFSKLGNYAGVSIETISMAKSLDFYHIFGIVLSAGSVDNPWMTLTHSSGFNISFMKPLSCPHLFFNPSLTYFNGKSNTDIIAAIRKENIPITENITYFNEKAEVENVIIRDPGGLGFFIFND